MPTGFTRHSSVMTVFAKQEGKAEKQRSESSSRSHPVLSLGISWHYRCHYLWGWELRRNGPHCIIPNSSASQPTKTPASRTKRVLVGIGRCAPLCLEGKVIILVTDDLEIKFKQRSFCLHGPAPLTGSAGLSISPCSLFSCLPSLPSSCGLRFLGQIKQESQCPRVRRLWPGW